MAATHIHAFVNAVFWYALYLITNLAGIDAGLISQDPISGLYFILGGIVFDVDHLLYYILTTKPPSIGKIKKRMEQDYQNSNPHPYIFHSIEFITVSAIFLAIVPNEIYLVLIVGWAVHMLTDTIVYIREYRSCRPWLPYFCLIYYYCAVKDSTPNQ